MNEVFQSYKHYSEWILFNWHRSSRKDNLIITAGLMVEKNVSCNGEAYRQLTRGEFHDKESECFIKIPF